MHLPRFFQDKAVKIPVIPAQAWNPEKAAECWIPSLRGNDGHGGRDRGDGWAPRLIGECVQQKQLTFLFQGACQTRRKEIRPRPGSPGTLLPVALAFPFLSRKCSPLFAMANSQAFPLFLNSS
jgi:hypothetical protein